MTSYEPLSNFLFEYRQTNADSLYKPVAVGKYGIRTRESIYTKELAKDYSKNKLIFNDTLTVGMGSNQIDIGVLSKDETYSVSPAYHTYKIKNINSKYLDYCLRYRNSDMFNRYVIRGSRQGKTIDFKNWLKYSIPVCSTTEQDYIVRILDAVCELEGKVDSLSKKYDYLVKSQFIEMFDGRLDQNCLEFQDIAQSISGGTPSTNHPEFYCGNIPFVSTPCLGPNYIDQTSTHTFISELAIRNSSTHLIPAYSLLVGIRIGIGKCSINTCDMCTNQDIISFYGIDTKNYDLLFLKKVIERNEQSYVYEQRGATIKGVKSSIIKRTKIPCATFDEQKNYSSFVNQIDKSKFRLKELQSKLETLYKSLLQKYFG